MKLPKRIQRKRTKGYKQPENTCYCGRGSKWGNPYKVGDKGLFIVAGIEAGYCINLKTSLALYERWLDEMIKLKTIDLTELLKYDYLSCWCPLTDKEGNHVPCHVDILINKLKEL